MDNDIKFDDLVESVKNIHGPDVFISEKSSTDWGYQGMQRMDKVPSVVTLRDIMNNLANGLAQDIGQTNGGNEHSFMISPLARNLSNIYDTIEIAKSSFKKSLYEDFIKQSPKRILAVKNSLKQLDIIEQSLINIAKQLESLKLEIPRDETENDF